MQFEVLYDRIAIASQPIGEPATNVSLHCTTSLWKDSKHLKESRRKETEVEAEGVLPIELMMEVGSGGRRDA